MGKSRDSTDDIIAAAKERLENLAAAPITYPNELAAQVYQLWWRAADFHIFIISPTYDTISPPRMIQPAMLHNTKELEFVYPIQDHGYRLSTSKGDESYSAGMSMCKLYLTIEKMVSLLVERLKENNISSETVVQVAFGGHELAQRKGFESVINLNNYNVVVTNFNPGEWGRLYLEMVQSMADKGYGYPSEVPRDSYRHRRGPKR